MREGKRLIVSFLSEAGASLFSAVLVLTDSGFQTMLAQEPVQGDRFFPKCQESTNAGSDGRSLCGNPSNIPQAPHRSLSLRCSV